MRRGSLASRGFESGRARDLMRLVVARVVSGEPFVSWQQILLVRTVIREFDAREKKKKQGDTFCRQGADHSFMDISEQEIDFPLGPVPNKDEFDADAVPFQPGFCYHCPYLLQPCLTGNLLCRVDWLSLRGIAGCECAILPILEIANFPRCSSGGQSSPGERPLGAPDPASP